MTENHQTARPRASLGPGASVKTVVLVSLVPCGPDYEDNN